MTELTTTFFASIQKFGRAFLLAFYLPAVVMTALHLYIFIPVWLGRPVLSAPAAPSILSGDIAQLITVFLLPIPLGLILLGLNDGLIGVYEGRPAWLRYTLLAPFAWYRRRQHQTHYAELHKLQRQHTARAVRLAGAAADDSADATLALRQDLAGLEQQIQECQNNLERRLGSAALPLAPARVMPTAFGNTYALAEEYAFERYGIDSVLFWPRLRDLMDKEAVSLGERISQQKIHLDMVLNLALFSGLVGVECVLVFFFAAPRPQSWVWAAAGAGALALERSFYAQSVRAVRLQGEFIKMSFDFHRHLILDAFKLRTPAGLVEEQILWVRLAAFIRRGSSFYFPSDMRKTETTK